jgi:hypothetical protein
MTLSSADFPSAAPNSTGFIGVHGQAPVGRGSTSPSLSVPSPLANLGSMSPTRRVFDITLIYSGRNVRHQIYDSMPVATLMEEAGGIFGLNPSHMILMLFTGTPTTLPPSGSVYGPPRVEENATVFVFMTQAVSQNNASLFRPQPPRSPEVGFSPFQVGTAVSSKLLSS